MDKQVSTKQFTLIAYIIGISVKLFMAPALLIRYSGRDSYLVIAVFSAIDFINLFLIVRIMKRNPDKTFNQILKETMGGVISRIIVGIFILFLLSKIILILGEIHLFFSSAVFDEFSWMFMVIPLLVMLFVICRKSLRTLGRVAELTVPILVVCGIVLFILLIRIVDPAGFFPFLEDGISPVIQSITDFPMWFCDAPIFVIFLGNVKYSKKMPLAVLSMYIFALSLGMLIPLSLYSNFGHMPTLIDYGHNASRLSQYGFGTSEMGRFDILIYCVWLMGIYFYVALDFYALTRNIGFMIKKEKSYTWIALVSLLIIYILSVFIFNGGDLLFKFFTGSAKYALCPLIYGLPFILFVMCRIKYKPNYHSENNTDTDADKKDAENDSDKKDDNNQKTAEKNSENVTTAKSARKKKRKARHGG